jgi:hypothetical protein
VKNLIGLVDTRTDAIDDEEQLLQDMIQARTTQILTEIAKAQTSLDVELRFSIEEDLQLGSLGKVALFELPYTKGGYLNSVPIGVQSISTAAVNAITKDEQAADPIASDSLNSANAALEAGNYLEAFTLYGQAYREAVSF